nr:hypothetical protein [uncultured Flavobacterium sp.]
MGLNNFELEKFKLTIKKAAEELGTNEILFTSEWIYDLPTQSIKINEIPLHEKYDIPLGWDGYGINDLFKLEKMGFLLKIYESDEDPITFEKTIKFLII